MFKYIKFSIENPPSLQAIKLALVKAKLVKKTLAWLTLPVIVGAVFVGRIVYNLHPFGQVLELSLLKQFYDSIAAGLSGLFILYLWISISQQLDNYILKLSDLDGVFAKDALSLTQEFQELESYRKSVVKERKLAYGDFLVMSGYAEKEREKNLAVQQENKRKLTLAKLNGEKTKALEELNRN